MRAPTKKAPPVSRGTSSHIHNRKQASAKDIVASSPKSNAIRPALFPFDGHADFYKYQRAFDRLYLAASTNIITPTGIEISFPMDSCRHACYGGTKSDWDDPRHFYTDRARRIPWIEFVLTHPTRIHLSTFERYRLVYLLHLPATKEDPTEEFYCAITHPLTPTTHRFVTAYNLTQQAYRTKSRLKPQIYPIV